MADYPQYQIVVHLDNGMTFTVLFGSLPGLPPAIQDALAGAAAAAIRDFGWAALPITPKAAAAAVTLTRQDIASTGITLP